MRLVIALVSLALVAAQDIQVIQVGGFGGTPKFDPPSIKATNGTIVTFRFTGSPGNHSVTQSSFKDPCTLLPNGFDSGNVFIPAGSNFAQPPEWNLTITDTKPIWFFCKQPVKTHCQVGMVGAINAPESGNTFDGYVQNAKAFNGTVDQAQGNLVGIGASASALPGPLPSGVSLFTGVAASPSTANGAAPSSSQISTAPGSVPAYPSALSDPAAGNSATQSTTTPSQTTQNSTTPSSSTTSSGSNSAASIMSVNSFGTVLAAGLSIIFL